MASRPPSPDDPTVASADDSVVPELDEKHLANTANRTGGSKPVASSPDDDYDDEDEHDVEDDEDDEELVVFTAKEAAGANSRACAELLVEFGRSRIVRGSGDRIIR